MRRMIVWIVVGCVSTCIVATIGWCALATASSSEPPTSVRVIGLRLVPGDRPATIVNDCHSDALVLALADLGREGIGGTLRCGGESQWHTAEPHGTIVVILSHQITEPVDLPLPLGDVVYRQVPSGFVSYPSDIKTSSEVLHLYPDPASPKWATLFSVRDPRGARRGSTLLTWGR